MPLPTTLAALFSIEAALVTCIAEPAISPNTGIAIEAASAIPNPFLIGQKVVDGNDVVILQTREDDANMESQTSFHLNQLHVEGYDVPRKAKKELSQIEKKYNNRDITMEDLQLAVAEVTECYRKAGLPAATAYLPEQESYDGTIHIKVVVIVS